MQIAPPPSFVMHRRLFAKNPQFAEAYVALADITVLVSPIACASFADTRARRRLGIAIAATIPMMATTIRSSMSVKPVSFFPDFEAMDDPQPLGLHVQGWRPFGAPPHRSVCLKLTRGTPCRSEWGTPPAERR